MDVNELRVRVTELGINPNFYSILGTKAMEGLVLEKNGHKWDVYRVDERGGKHEERTFILEKDACEFFFDKMRQHKALFG